MGPRPPGTTVFVGNISYDTTEEQLREVFSQVGNVVSFRLMYDHDTGRAKGFGFCEYEDKETAMSARRNLNGTPLNGRPLRVDLTESDKQNAALNGLTLNPTTPTQPSSSTGSTVAPTHPALPPALASANPSMASMSLPDIHRTMLHLKKAVVQNPNELRELLLAHPRLSQAILQGQIMLGMVPPPPPTNAPRIPARMQQQPRAPQRPQQQPRMPMPRPPMQRPPQVPPQPIPPQISVPPRPMVIGPPPQGVANGVQNAMMNAGAGMQGMRMPPPQGRMPPPQGMQPVVADEQAAILNKIMTMSQQEIDALAPEHKNYVLQLKDIVRQNAGMGGGMGGGMGVLPGGMQMGTQQGPLPPGPPPPPGQYR